VAIDSVQVQDFARDGFLLLRGFFAPERVAAIRRHIDALWATRRAGNPFVIDAYLETPRACRMFFREAEDDVRHGPYKLNDLHLDDEVIQQISLDAGLIAVLGELLGSTPIAINTLLLEYGSQQQAHFDTYFMPSRTPNMMIASWIALEAATETNGPLFYYPGSHRIEPYRFSNGGISAIAAEMEKADAYRERMIARHGLAPVTLLAEPGDVLIWHAQLLHGGSPIRQRGETRMSLVTHYWTTHDYPDAESRIEIGPDQYLLRRPHQEAFPRAVMRDVEEFLRSLTTPPAHRAAVPPDFNARRYLLLNADVLAARMDPHTHYAMFGKREGRGW